MIIEDNCKIKKKTEHRKIIIKQNWTVQSKIKSVPISDFLFPIELSDFLFSIGAYNYCENLDNLNKTYTNL